MKRLTLIGLLLFTGLFLGTTDAEAQIFNTKLRITVLDKLGNVVPEAEVTLYASKEDYTKETNPVHPTELTDDKGRVTFKKLDAQSYYVIVRKGDMTNIGGGEIISELEEKKLNKANVIITDEL